MKKTDWITRKLAYLYLKLSEFLVNLITYIYAVIYRKKQNDKSDIKSIAAYWYYSEDLTGSNLRLGGWTSLFEKDGYSYTNFHINRLSEYVAAVEKGTWTKRYFFFARCLWRRLPQMLQSHHYDVLWIDRGIIPFYPRKNAFLEKQLKKVVHKLVVDTTDGGDYKGNPVLMEDVLKTADEITVGYKHLKEFYEDRFKVTQVFWTIPTDNYRLKSDYAFSSKPVIGWMGSPGNFSYVLQLVPQLQALAKKHDFVFRYICRQNFDKELVGINTEHHFFGDDYYDLLASFDIGISPFLVANIQTKGKIAMKHQEFLLMGTPQVCSPVAISELVTHEKEVIIADTIEDWADSLTLLIESQELREQLGVNSKKLFLENYTFEHQYKKLKKVLVER